MLGVRAGGNQCGTTRPQLAVGADAAGAALGAGVLGAGAGAAGVAPESPVEDPVGAALEAVLSAPEEVDEPLDDEPRLSFL